MKICLWFQTTEGPWGGANQFLRSIGKELRRLGHEVSQEPAGGEDIVLLNAFLKGPGRELRPNEIEYVRRFGVRRPWSRFVPRFASSAVKRSKAVFVHRLDGVAHLIRGRVTSADHVQPAVNALCDYTIFQSQYCVDSFRTDGNVSPRNFTIINNGVDGSVFFPSANHRPEPPKVLKIGASSWSPNPRKGFAQIAALAEVPGVEVEFAGRWAEGIPSRNVRLVGAKSSGELAEWLRTLDAMLHAAENEPCSNAILEGLASGLPMLYLDSGGNRELAGNYGIAIGSDLAASVAALRERYGEFHERLRAERTRFLIEGVARQYVDAFDEAIRLRSQS